MRDAGVGERADHGVAPAGVSGQFRLEQGRQEERVAGQFRDPDVPVVGPARELAEGLSRT